MHILYTKIFGKFKIFWGKEKRNKKRERERERERERDREKGQDIINYIIIFFRNIIYDM